MELHDAIHSEDSVRVGELLKDPGLDVNLRVDSMSPLYIACLREMEDIVKMLLDDPRVDPNLEGPDKAPAIHICDNGILKLLVNHPRISIKDLEGLYCDLIKKVNSERLEIVLSNPLVDPNTLTKEGYNPLVYISGYIESIGVIVKNPRINVNLECPIDEICPLYKSCKRGHHTTTEYLLSHPDIDVNKAREDDKRTPLHALTELESSWVLMNLLLSHPKINVNPRDIHGCTPFFYFCEKGIYNGAQKMLGDKRLEIDVMSNDGRTPFSCASEKTDLRLLKLLVLDGRRIDFSCRGDSKILTIIRSNPWKFRCELWREYNILDEKVTFLFTTSILISEGYLKHPPTGSDEVYEKHMRRFYDFVLELPMELRMIICNRICGSPQDIISVKTIKSNLRKHFLYE